MTILELGALGEFVGSIAVLATLIYLAVQVHQTKRTVQSASHQSGLAVMAQNNQTVFSDQELSDIVLRGFDDKLQDEAERFRFGLWCTSLFHVFQQYFLDSEKGQGDARVWAGEQRAMRELLGNPGVARWWREMPGLPYSDAFSQHVEMILSTAEDTQRFRRLREKHKISS